MSASLLSHPKFLFGDLITPPGRVPNCFSVSQKKGRYMKGFGNSQSVRADPIGQTGAVCIPFIRQVSAEMPGRRGFPTRFCLTKAVERRMWYGATNGNSIAWPKFLCVESVWMSHSYGGTCRRQASHQLWEAGGRPQLTAFHSTEKLLRTGVGLATVDEREKHWAL